MLDKKIMDRLDRSSLLNDRKEMFMQDLIVMTVSIGRLC